MFEGGILYGGKNSLYADMKYSHDRFLLEFYFLVRTTTMQNAYLPKRPRIITLKK